MPKTIPSDAQMFEALCWLFASSVFVVHVKENADSIQITLHGFAEDGAPLFSEFIAIFGPGPKHSVMGDVIAYRVKQRLQT